MRCLAVDRALLDELFDEIARHGILSRPWGVRTPDERGRTMFGGWLAHAIRKQKIVAKFIFIFENNLLLASIVQILFRLLPAEHFFLWDRTALSAHK
jgi:hypothetical protein